MQNDLLSVPFYHVFFHCFQGTKYKRLGICSVGRFKSFNMQFEELHARQSQWTIPDHELRDDLRLAIAEVLLPAYRSFINRFGYVE
jgi:hypothetical protein